MTRTTELAALVVLIAGLAVAGAAAAQEDPMMFSPHEAEHGIDFPAIDTDGNGALSRAELEARAAERLARGDANGDGALDRVELSDAMSTRRSRFLSVFSSDPAEAMADRILALMGGTEAGRVEVAALAARRVNTLLAYVDTDRDAAVSMEEAEALDARHEGWRDHHRGMGHGEHDRPGPDERPGPPRG